VGILELALPKRFDQLPEGLPESWKEHVYDGFLEAHRAFTRFRLTLEGAELRVRQGRRLAELQAKGDPGDEGSGL